VIIAGSHRSGTSLTAQYLQKCGLFLGDSLLPGNASNPHGHFEDRDVISIHDSILAANGVTWRLHQRIVPVIPDTVWSRLQDFVEQRQARHTLWGFKDPRVCHFLSLWRMHLPDAKFLIVYRNPIECVRSMNKRHAQDCARGGQRSAFYSEPDLALRIWTASNLMLAEFAEANPELIVLINHNSLSKGMALSERLNDLWRLNLEQRSTAEVYDSALSISAAKPLRIADSDVGSAAQEVWSRLRKLEASTSGKSVTQEDDKIMFHHETNAEKLLMENELLTFEINYCRQKLRDTSQAEKAIETLERQLRAEQFSAAKANHAYQAIASSTSWKISKPLRVTVNRFREIASRQKSK